MNNKIELTDDELSLIVTSLATTVASTKGYIERNGKEKLDFLTLKTFEDMNNLLKKLESDYF